MFCKVSNNYEIGLHSQINVILLFIYKCIYDGGKGNILTCGH